MTWLTFLTGLALFALGAGCRWQMQLQQWQALLPLVFGLLFITLAEGMRTKPAYRRTFLVLAILWSLVILVVSFPFVQHFLEAWQLQPVVMNGDQIRAELVLEHSSVFVVATVYLLVACVQVFRKPRSISSTPSPTPRSSR